MNVSGAEGNVQLVKNMNEKRPRVLQPIVGEPADQEEMFSYTPVES